MKLFYSPGACSLAPHIVLNELGIPYTAEKVDLKAHTYAEGSDFYAINPKGSVPVLQIDNGDVLTEGVAIGQYLADQRPEKNMMPKWGSWERYRAVEMLNFLASEVHKGFGPLFGAARLVPPEAVAPLKEKTVENLNKKFKILDTKLQATPYLLGDHFSIADAYLFVMLTWAKNLQLDLHDYPALMGFSERVAERPAVRKTLQSEGLGPKA